MPCHSLQPQHFQLTTSRRGRLVRCEMLSCNNIFQLTTSRRGRPASFIEVIKKYAFQLTTSRRGRQCMRRLGMPGKPFNSRPHAEVDETVGLSDQALLSFNSRPHAEVDGVVFAGLQAFQPFNSRPHAEVDFSRKYSAGIIKRLSTHDLTQRSTRWRSPPSF